MKDVEQRVERDNIGSAARHAVQRRGDCHRTLIAARCYSGQVVRGVVVVMVKWQEVLSIAIDDDPTVAVTPREVSSQSIACNAILLFASSGHINDVDVLHRAFQRCIVDATPIRHLGEDHVEMPISGSDVEFEVR
jgi:hypothetical protein